MLSCLDRLNHTGTATAYEAQPQAHALGPFKRTQVDAGTHVIQKLLASRGSTTRRKYLVQWLGQPVTNATWKPTGNLPETMRGHQDQRQTYTPLNS